MLNLLNIIIFSAFIKNSFGQIGMGPINLNIIRAESCASENDLIELNLGNEKNHLTVKVNTDDAEFGNNVGYKLRFHKIQNGQIQKDIFKTEGPNMCEDLIKVFGKFWERVLEAVNLPTKCPMPAGTYEAKNIPVLVSEFMIKKFIYGRFLVNCEIINDKVKVGCIEFEITNNRPGESV